MTDILLIAVTGAAFLAGYFIVSGIGGFFEKVLPDSQDEHGGKQL